MHTLKYMRLKISLNPRSSVRLRHLKALKKLFDLQRKKTGESSAKMNISNPNTNSAPLPWHVSLALLDPCWTSLSATSTQGAQGCLGQHLLAASSGMGLCASLVCSLFSSGAPAFEGVCNNGGDAIGHCHMAARVRWVQAVVLGVLCHHARRRAEHTPKSSSSVLEELNDVKTDANIATVRKNPAGAP